MIRPCDMMVVAMSRLIGDGDTVFHGVSSHMPMIATLLAKKTHAPNAVHLNIPGGVDPVKPALREYTSAGGELWESACAKLPLMEVFDLSMRGGLDVAFLSGVQFDSRGHVNASVIGDYHKPKVRLPGGAGSAVLIPTARRAIIWRTKHDKRTFTGKVDFVTARGNVSDIVTPLCVFTMHEGELILKSVRRPPRRRSCVPCARSTPWITGASSSDDCSFGNDKNKIERKSSIMSRFDTYFLMKEADVIEYVKAKYPDFFAPEAVLTVKEIGDGNLNYVFRVVEAATGKSIIVKQAGVSLRISAEMKVSTDRNRIESEILQIQDKYAPGLVPKIYGYDTVMCACAMEDLSDHALMRYALMRHETFPRFAEDISTYMVNTLLKTTDVAMEHKEKKAMVKSFINPELCEITEDLVLTEPYNDCNHRNNVFPPIADFVKKELYEDEALKLAVAKIKFEFMNNAQALIHGDLHTGSIFVKQDSTRVFDPEFAFYGPMGYDIGNVVANMIFAWDNGRAAGADAFCDWCLKAIADTIDLFCEKFLVCFDACVTDLMAKTPGFKEYYLESVLSDTAAYAGTELIRRTVGMANVKDVTTIADEAKRAHAEKVNILCAKDYIMNRTAFKNGADFIAAVTRADEAAK